MRHFILAGAAALALAATVSFVPGSAQAMTLKGAAITEAAKSTASLDNVRIVCRRAWNGRRWVRVCRRGW